MIALEKKEKKYDVALHRERLEVILQNWDTILQIIEEEIPSAAELEQLLDAIRAGDTNSASELTLLAVDNWQISFHANYHDGEMFCK